MSRWYINLDTVAAPDDAEWAPWVRYTRTPPPPYVWGSTDAVAEYTPEEQATNSAMHESAHAVVYMASGYQIGEIVLHEPADHSHGGRAHVTYLAASGPWLDWAVTCAAGERAEVRWMRETGRWSSARAWVAERLAWRDRSQIGEIYRSGHSRELTFNGDHNDWGDYAWIMDRADEALDPIWEQVLTLAHYVAEHRQITGEEAARVTGFAH